MFGVGLNENIIDAYQWLIERYNEGDELFIFGFSRGAYTARSLSGLISKCGLLEAGAPLSVNQLFARYRLASVPRTIRELRADRDAGKSDFSIEEEWMLTYSRPIDVKFIGVWDTVGSLGIPLAGVPGFGKSSMRFLNTGLRRSNKFAYHAMAIDEHRKAFAPTLWTVDSRRNERISSPRDVTEVEQRWFVGAHANVGGGYASDILAQAPLKWLMDKAILHGLAFKKEVTIHVAPAPCVIADSYSEFMYGAFKLLTLWRRHYRPIGAEPESSGDSVRSVVNETIDASVFERWQLDAAYRPPGLSTWIDRKTGRSIHTPLLGESGRPGDTGVSAFCLRMDLSISLDPFPLILRLGSGACPAPASRVAG